MMLTPCLQNYPLQNQKNEDLMKKSYQKLLQIFDLLEDSLLPEIKEKMLR